MGNENTKKKKVGSNLTLEQKNMILENLKCLNISDKTQISSDAVKKLWGNIFSDNLFQLYSTYIFRNKNTISIEEFEELFYKMVESSYEEKSKILSDILSENSVLKLSSLRSYVSDLLHSYINILRVKAKQNYDSWTTNEKEETCQIDALSTYLVKDLSSGNGEISVEDLELWIRKSPFVNEISESVLKIGFGIDKENLRPKLPRANRQAMTMLETPTILLFSHLTRSFVKTWRLLYSSNIESHSWQIFYNKILRQGPTLVLVRDKNNSLFGGYASTSWQLSPNFYGDEQSFLFTLSPEIKLFFPTGYNSNFQYLNSGAATLPNGLGMGGQLNYFGFFLSSEFGPGTVSKSCTTYKDYVQLASTGEFTFTDLEIWAVGEPDPIEEGVRQPGSGLSLERDPAAMAILELAGKGGHAKAAGEVFESED